MVSRRSRTPSSRASSAARRKYPAGSSGAITFAFINTDSHGLDAAASGPDVLPGLIIVKTVGRSPQDRCLAQIRWSILQRATRRHAGSSSPECHGRTQDERERRSPEAVWRLGQPLRVVPCALRLLLVSDICPGVFRVGARYRIRALLSATCRWYPALGRRDCTACSYVVAVSNARRPARSVREERAQHVLTARTARCSIDSTCDTGNPGGSGSEHGPLRPGRPDGHASGTAR